MHEMGTIKSPRIWKIKQVIYGCENVIEAQTIITEKANTWHAYRHLLSLCPGQALLADLSTFSLSYIKTPQSFLMHIQEPSQ